jgi:hypothetical protein
MRCREITPADLEGVLALLQDGFPERSREWLAGKLARIAMHATPPGYPKYGFLLEVDGTFVGVLLVVFSLMIVNGETRIRANLSSWYVEPRFRSFAVMLTSRATAYPDVTYVNVTPSRHTWPILDAQGYKRFCTGQFVAVAALSKRSFGARVRAVSGVVSANGELSPSEVALLTAHARFGCLAVTVERAGCSHPFVFARTRIPWNTARWPAARLVYCRTTESFVQFAGPLGRFLTMRGMPVVVTDANGPIRGLVGKFVEWGPKFFLGPHPPHLGDLAYTESAM